MSEDLTSNHITSNSIIEPMTVAVTGSSGFVGSAWMDKLRDDGIIATRLVRDKNQLGEGSVFWDSFDVNCDLSELSGTRAVIHLAGESIIGLWTPAKRRRIYESRVTATKNLVTELCALENPPKTLICASAVGYYGDRGVEELTEDSDCGDGFLATTCRDWEAASGKALSAGIRVVNLRIGVVLDSSGGAFQKTVSAFRMGLGGRFGSGDQYMSWITRDDLCRAMLFVLKDDSLSGIVNAVAPFALTNAEYTKKLSAALRRPSFLTAPEFLLGLAPGGFAREMLLASVRVVPSRLLSAGFEFNHSNIDLALKALLSK